ncbi:MAG: response regulator [Anaerolineae bacterium]
MAKAKILLVDDYAATRRSLKMVLEAAGYEVVVAETGEEALAALERHHPALVLLDVILPDINGLDLCRQIRNDARWKEIYIILLSGYRTSAQDRAEGLNLGADDYLVRPVANHELLARIRAGLRIHRVEADLRRERDLLDRMMETSPVGIILVDCEGQITFANARAEEILGLSRDSLTQLSYNAPQWRITDYEGQPFPEEELPFRQVMATGSPVYDVRHAIESREGGRTLLSINAAPLRDEMGEIVGMVATIEDVTERVQEEKQHREQLERELRALAGLTSPPQTTVTATMFGTVPLRDSYPQAFEEFHDTYGELLDRALAARVYKVSSDLSDALRAFARRLGTLRAGPRDVIDLHSSTLQAKIEAVPPQKARAYVEEGHLVVLELMGYLVLYYRNLVVYESFGYRETTGQSGRRKEVEDEG